DSILPSGSEIEAHEAEDAAEVGDLAAAERGFRAVVDEDAANPEAAVGLAKLLVDRGDLEEARPLVAKALPDPEAERLHAQIEVADWANEAGPGTLASAKRLAAAGRWREALDGMV